MNGIPSSSMGHAYDTISSKSMEWIKQNIRYRSTIAKYRVAPPSFEEWLNECKRLRMIPYFQASNDTRAQIADKIMGKGNYLSWNGNRDFVDGVITLSKGDTETAEGFVARCDELGTPVYIGIGLSSKTDLELKEIVEALHAKGYGVLWSSCYNTVANNQRALKLGFDLSTSGWDIPDFEVGNLCNLSAEANFNEFSHNGTDNDGILTLANEQSVTPNVNLSSLFLGGGSLHIKFTGTLHVKMGKFIDDNITSDGELTNWFSTYFMNEIPDFELTAVGNVTISELIYKAKKC